MHDGVQYDPIHVRGHEPLKIGNSVIFKSYFLPHFQWGPANDHAFLNSGTIPKLLKLIRAEFFIFGLLFVSCDFEVDRNVTCEVDRQSRTGLIFSNYYLFNVNFTTFNKI